MKWNGILEWVFEGWRPIIYILVIIAANIWGFLLCVAAFIKYVPVWYSWFFLIPVVIDIFIVGFIIYSFYKFIENGEW